MKTIWWGLAFGLAVNVALAQENPKKIDVEEATATIGILQGGGALVGVDFQQLVTPKFSLQAGLGWLAYGGGINFHFKPGIRSSFLSLQYRHQGIGNSFVQSSVGPSFVYRGKKWFTCQLGAGRILQRGPAYPSEGRMPKVILLYSIGGYLPL